MKKIGIINGPNLNLLGKREQAIYGDTSFEEYCDKLEEQYRGVAELNYYQSNIEGELIDKIQEWGFSMDGIILNAGGYSHTSIAIADAVKSIPSQTVGVHISNIFNREKPRHNDLLLGACTGNISGFGLESYRLALKYLMEK